FVPLIYFRPFVPSHLPTFDRASHLPGSRCAAAIRPPPSLAVPDVTRPRRPSVQAFGCSSVRSNRSSARRRRLVALFQVEVCSSQSLFARPTLVVEVEVLFLSTYRVPVLLQWGGETRLEEALVAMEKISAASAMEWSIELDKGLRSRKPGQAVKAIQQTGSRLQQWDQEPEPTKAAHKIFDLVAGEERFFLNCILLKLSDAFRSGDKDIRVSVVKVFLSLFKMRRKTKRYHGVMSKAKMCNPLELLKRVKIVFDTGDLESRVLALVLFGSWAEFSRDNAHIRYIILSSLVSSEVMEVKASLFAAGCFCKFAYDFAPVVLEMLPRIVASSELSSTLRAAGANVFAKMGYFSPNAVNGYKIGLKLLLYSSDEDLSVSLLLSLSKLAYKSSSILPDQVEVLLSFLSQEKPLHQQSTALRCLRLLSSPVCSHPVGLLTVKPLLRIVHDTKLPISMQCDALRILHKVFPESELLIFIMFKYQKMHMPGDVMREFSKVLTILDNANQSNIESNRVLVISILADVLIKNSRKTGTELDGNCDSFPSLTWIISTIIGQIISLVKQLLDSNRYWDVALPEVRRLLAVLLFVAGEHLVQGVIVLDRIRLVIDYLVNHLPQKAIVSTVTAPTGQEMDHFRAKNFGTSLKIANQVHKFAVACIQNLIELGASAAEVLDKVKMLVDCVHRCSLFGSYVQAVYSIQVHSSVFWGCAVNKSKQGCSPNRQLGDSDCDLLIKHEIFTLECVMEMLKEKNFWQLYTIGKFAAGQGAWVTAKFIFEQIASKVQSESSSCWLKSLAQHAQCEMRIQLFLLPKLRCSLAEWSLTKEIPILYFRNISCGSVDQGVSVQVCGESYGEVLVEAHNSIRSSAETLDCVVKFGNSFYFQRWFLALRMLVLTTVYDVLKVLGSSGSGHAEGSLAHGLSSVQQITQCSFRLTRLAQELDLLYISFINMDTKSSNIISALALSCSLLAFTSGTAASFATVHANDNSNLHLNRMSIEDLAGRLWLIDPDTCSILFQLLDVSLGIDHPHVQPRNQKLESGEVRDITSICHDVVSRVDGFRNELKDPVDNVEALLKVTVESFQLLLNTIVKWLQIPFKLPMYFFKTRPCLVSELFTSNADATNQNELIVQPGCDLSLNLCIQLKNLPDLPTPISKLYCIVYSITSFAESSPTSRGTKTGQIQRVDFKDWHMDDMVQANEKLFHHVRDRANKTTDRGRKRPRVEEGVVQSVVQFEVNNRGQGFSSCVLGVSGFPEGCYRIKWHSCCVDGRGRYWSLLPSNSGPVFTVCRS
ncbi:unnamed protein product, partial [Linum tenue]